jgi:cytochrome c oxidase assembly factor 3, fungi type
MAHLRLSDALGEEVKNERRVGKECQWMEMELGGATEPSRGEVALVASTRPPRWPAKRKPPTSPHPHPRISHLQSTPRFPLHPIFLDQTCLCKPLDSFRSVSAHPANHHSLRTSYYDRNNRQTAALIRARRPYLFKNIWTGLALSAFTIGVYSYTISAIGQDEFEDVVVPERSGELPAGARTLKEKPMGR